MPLVALQFSDDMQRKGFCMQYQVALNHNETKMIFTTSFGESVIEETGNIETKMLYVYKISLSGEGSGTAYQKVILPALMKSTGHLKALLVWEGGDYICVIDVTDGEITETEL